MVERSLLTLEVRGSNPVIGEIFWNRSISAALPWQSNSAQSKQCPIQVWNISVIYSRNSKHLLHTCYYPTNIQVGITYLVYLLVNTKGKPVYYSGNYTYNQMQKPRLQLSCTEITVISNISSSYAQQKHLCNLQVVHPTKMIQTNPAAGSTRSRSGLEILPVSSRWAGKWARGGFGPDGGSTGASRSDSKRRQGPKL